VGVAFMLSLASKKTSRGKRKARPVNPQSQRLWDVVQGMSLDGAVRPFAEPTYSSNHAPLVVRARTLQRRLNSLGAGSVVLRETSVPSALNSLFAQFLPQSPGGANQQPAGTAFRSFERGLSLRRKFVTSILQSGLLLRPLDLAAAFPFGGDDVVEALSGSVEVFQALVTAVVAACHVRQMTSLPLPGFEQAGGGWVHLPEFGALEKNI